MEKPLAITIGDVCGVGPEILLRTAAAGTLPAGAVAYGDLPALELCRETLGLDVAIQAVAGPEEAAAGGALKVIDAGLLQRGDITVGRISGPCGAAAVEYVRQATLDALAGKVAGIVTLPINKEASRGAHPDFQGHTELIAGLCGSERYTMMLASPKMIVTHVSTHVSLAEAIRRVTTERVLEVIELSVAPTTRLRGRARIAVAGLNPHAGEHGAFGREDIEAIGPAVERARERGIDAHGPIAPDTLFLKAAKGEYDAVVCMYHDQGHIPMKLHGFADAVNITIGLPIIRASVDHGTAFDIAWQGKADTANFATACAMAEKLIGSTCNA